MIETNNYKTVVVLGMHKSGTTLISEMLHKSGVSMVSHNVGRGEYSSGRTYERQETKDINKSLLQAHNTHSLDINLRIPYTTDENEKSIKRVIKNNSTQSKPWGFKDPRNTLTYNIWSKHLPTHKVIAVFRHPAEVWARYSSRSTATDPRIALPVFHHWVHYNKRILHYKKKRPRSMYLIEYSDLMQNQGSVGGLEEYMGMALNDTRNMSLYRNKNKPGVLFAAFNKLYNHVTNDSCYNILGKLREAAR